jgi:hypothetical protein
MLRSSWPRKTELVASFVDWINCIFLIMLENRGVSSMLGGLCIRQRAANVLEENRVRGEIVRSDQGVGEPNCRGP